MKNVFVLLLIFIGQNSFCHEESGLAKPLCPLIFAQNNVFQYADGISLHGSEIISKDSLIIGFQLKQMLAFSNYLSYADDQNLADMLMIFDDDELIYRTLRHDQTGSYFVHMRGYMAGDEVSVIFEGNSDHMRALTSDGSCHDEDWVGWLL